MQNEFNKHLGCSGPAIIREHRTSTSAYLHSPGVDPIPLSVTSERNKGINQKAPGI
jgi:hypothetical protein